MPILLSEQLRNGKPRCPSKTAYRGRFGGGAWVGFARMRICGQHLRRRRIAGELPPGREHISRTRYPWAPRGPSAGYSWVVQGHSRVRHRSEGSPVAVRWQLAGGFLCLWGLAVAIGRGSRGGRNRRQSRAKCARHLGGWNPLYGGTLGFRATGSLGDYLMSSKQ
ncbi:uncharacterized protein K489DRAFT_237108 [Dissoconium aciculare CBS 342.82]|uniref:Uncharacterized protein n=1 Tax=Dissoconium aciculare CBS 342.82 TaxID=1314786 RepID=A0A6J3M2K6_9PEZI|nr:uncharacterized protein K489DRAFT_237108 [Dissoconium aciculare CBS 342.82]KAF1822256.1 hypothetical protein K489DRAFT_237108 [Dissoconium aciculare CBS 342.82]